MTYRSFLFFKIPVLIKVSNKRLSQNCHCEQREAMYKASTMISKADCFGRASLAMTVNDF